MKAVYNPKAVIPHAALLHQAYAHCAIFPTAASRRSLGRISVPMWPVTLSGRLPVAALVGHYPTNKLIGRETIPDRIKLSNPTHAGQAHIRDYHQFPGAIPKSRARSSRVTHPFATRVPPERGLTVRLACVKHAASVRPEPGSNSPLKKYRHNHNPTPKGQDHSRNRQQKVEPDQAQKLDSIK